jgi:hypothetical protein
MSTYFILNKNRIKWAKTFKKYKNCTFSKSGKLHNPKNKVKYREEHAVSQI